MISLAAGVRIFVFTGATDMRKSFNGLSGLVSEHFEAELLSGHLFLFFNRKRDCVKILTWDRDGLAIWFLLASSIRRFCIACGAAPKRCRCPIPVATPRHLCDFAPGSRTEGTVKFYVNCFSEKPRAAVCQDELGSAGMQAAKTRHIPPVVWPRRVREIVQRRMATGPIPVGIECS
jgi:hypothetical protein